MWSCEVKAKFCKLIVNLSTLYAKKVGELDNDFLWGTGSFINERAGITGFCDDSNIASVTKLLKFQYVIYGWPQMLLIKIIISIG